MEVGLKVVALGEEARLITKGMQWLPSGDVEKDTLKDLEEVERGQKYLETTGKVTFQALAREIPQGYKGELEFEVKMRTDGKDG